METDFERYMSFRALIQASETSRTAIKYPFTEIIEKQGKGGGPPIIIQKGATASTNDKDRRFGEYAIVTRDRINSKGENESTELEIQSEAMQKALHTIIGKRSQVGVFADPIVFRKPYYSLFHCRREINDAAANEYNTPEEKQHLQWLTSFMSEKLKDLEKVQQSQVENGLIEFKHLPIIFEAGSIVIGQANKNIKIDRAEKMEKTENPECFLFHEITDEQEDKLTGGKYVDIKVFRWGYNGSMFGLTAETLHIAEFAGLRKITELECHPWAHMKEEVKNELFPKLVARGGKWCEYLEAQNFSYNGIAQVPKRATWSWDVKVIAKGMPGRIILDYPAFMAAFPELNSPLHNRSREDAEDTVKPVEECLRPSNSWAISSRITLPLGDLWTCFEKGNYSPSDAQKLLCPATSPGYSLEQKDWGYFDIDQLQDVEWAHNPIKELEIDDVQKEVLRDLIIEHHSKEWPKNIVPGKGEGLIFLLYGPPGCGKTLTAELLAEEEKRPLLRISCGDLGHFPPEVDRNLQALLKLASRGSAIVLIDEADAFLSKRVRGTNRDFIHNAIVSVFLKHLEYFPGVIFLTTNEETEFDEAVSSRVVPLHYGALDSKRRAKIWRTHLLKAGHDDEKDAIDSICEELGSDYELDGREIKTLARISLALCRRRKQRVSKEVIQQMYDMTHKPKPV